MFACYSLVISPICTLTPDPLLVTPRFFKRRELRIPVSLDTGTIYHDIESSNFKKIQDLIKQFQPTSFEDLEKFLI